tara:strand:- start:209 stop:364 length:156 start_codon:yes stop_codon:yes gene_type:complete
MSKDRIRVRVELFKQILQEQERVRKLALTAQVISLLALAIATGAMLLAFSL